MITQDTVNQIGALNGELREIVEAVDIFDHDHRIVNLTVATPIGEEPGRSIVVQTATMPYPAQMVAVIKTFLKEREDQLRKQLADLGFTN